MKADGYGHGAAECARAALCRRSDLAGRRDSGGGRVELGHVGIDTRLLVMGALIGDELDAAVDSRADVVCWTREFADALSAGHGRREPPSGST